MASSAPEQLWTGPRAAKEREDTIRGSRKWLGWPWRHINLLGRCNSRAKSSRIRSESSPQNGRPLGGLILGAAKGRISLVCGKSCGVLRTFVGRTPLFRYCTGRCWQSSSRAPSALSRTIVPPAEYSHRRRTMKTSRINRLRQPLAIYRRRIGATRAGDQSGTSSEARSQVFQSVMKECHVSVFECFSSASWSIRSRSETAVSASCRGLNSSSSRSFG